MPRRFYINIILLLFSLCSFAEEIPNYTFTSYNSDFGFVQKEVMRIMQDRNGQMWFATWDGLYRFDGYSFSNYKARPGDGIRLESNRLESISEDGDNIWMRGYNGSISCFSKCTTCIDNLPMNNYVAQEEHALPGGGVVVRMSDGRVVVARVNNFTDRIETRVVFGIKGTTVKKVVVERNGALWILTSRGTWRYDIKKHRSSKLFGGMECNGMTSGKTKSVFCCSKGYYMILEKGRLSHKKLPTPSAVSSAVLLPGGKILLSTLGDGLFLIGKDYNVERHFTADNSNLTSNRVSEMQQDHYGDVWFCTNKPGVMNYRHDSGELQCFHLQGEFSGDPSMWRNDMKIVEDSRGNLWLTPSGNGMAMYDRKRNQLVPFLDKNRHYAWTAENTVIDMFVDRQDNVWFCGKYTGLQKATYNAPQFNTLNHDAPTESGHDVRGVFQDSKGRIWLGAKSGVVSVYDDNLRFVGNLGADGRLSSECCSQVGHAYAFAEQKNGVMWIATKFGGLIRLEPTGPKSFRMRRFTADGKRYALPHNDIFSLCIDRHNRLWGATFGGGIFYTNLSAAEPRFIHAGNALTSYPIQKFGRTRFVCADRHGDIWVCATSGLLRFKDSFRNPSTIRFVSYTRQPDNPASLSYNDVLQAYFTSTDSMYVCTYGGGFCRVERCQGDSLRFTPYTTANGLRSDVLFSVNEEKKGNLWFASENGFVRYSPRRKSVENFSSRFFGKQIDINEGMSLRLHDGRLLYPSRNYTAVYFNPEKIKVSRFVPKIILTRLFVDQTEQQPSAADDAILAVDINSTECITLPHGKNSFNLEFSALDFRDPTNISYAYMIEGIDADWNMIGNRHSAIYNNLPPGKFVLKIRSTNSDGVWVDNMRKVRIEVLPSFWQTGWAWLLYIVIAILAVCVTAHVLATILQLKQKVAIEQEISDLKMKFFTSISHEIRTPLTLISGSIKEMLRRGVKEKPLDDALHVVDRNSDRLLGLVNQILDIRKIESGSMRLSLRRIDVGMFIASLMKNFSNLAREREISLHLEQPEEKMFIWADCEKLDKVMFNLLSNAFRFTPKGKSITVKLEKNEEGVRIKVVDEGSGISPDRINTIFRLFSSYNEGSAVSQPHTGIGLALTKDLVELHHGRIHVESQLGRGSSFIIELPSNAPGTCAEANYIMEDSTPYTTNEGRVEPESEVVEDGSEHNGDKEVLTKDRLTILVVEDNADMRNFISLILREEYNIVTAANGKIGLEMAADIQPDMILSDYMMPLMDGMKMAECLRNDISTSHIPIIMLSARTDEASVILGLRTGVDAYIEKPFSADVLRARIKNIIEMRRSLQQMYFNRFVNKDTNSLPSTPFVGSVAKTSSAAADSCAAMDTDQRFLSRLTALLEENISNGDLSVDDVARMMGMSRSVYFKKLKALTGVGPNDFFKSLRMQRAAEILDAGELSITEISYAVGIADAHYFSKCFKQKYGVTPTDWRRNNKPQSKGN